MPEEKTIWVKAAQRDGKSAFWERDRRHPASPKFPQGGEVSIAAPHPDEPEAPAVEVAETEMVRAALQEGRLVRAEAPKTLDAELPKAPEAKR
jgi:hypothetical protein